VLTTQMKSVGEAMAIGRTFKESLQKALRSLEIDSYGFDDKGRGPRATGTALDDKLRIPNARRIWYVADAFREGYSIEQIFALSKIDPWFLENIRQIVAEEADVSLAPEALRRAKAMGFSDVRLAQLLDRTEEEVRQARLAAGIVPAYKTVDTCGAEFQAHTPYLYSTYEHEDESGVTARKKIMILGGGPNRIGQGIEFDYCCVHAAFALKEAGFETIMVNCNPETVSTDYDTSDKLYFEPLTREDVLSIVEREKPDGVIVQFGGQTPLKLAVPLERAGVPIIGTSPDAIDRAEDRQRFAALLTQLELRQPRNGIAFTVDEAVTAATRIGYPVLVRPSYVLGGRAMEIVYDEASLRGYMDRAVEIGPGRPVLVDEFLEDAVEIDVDAISDGTTVIIGGIMEHIERAGVHSGDSACSLPAYSVAADVLDEIRRQTIAMAKELGVIGLMNVQFAVQRGTVFILEVNPRASRTVPFVSKVIGVPLAKLAARVMVGETLASLGLTREIVPTHIAVKEAVFPFAKFPGVDTLLGPEMKSTGEVMGIDTSFGVAFAKAQLGAGTVLPLQGTAFLSVEDADKAGLLPVAQHLARVGFRLIGTDGTASYLVEHGVAIEPINKVQDGSPHAVDEIRAGRIHLVINTPKGSGAQRDSFPLRRAALEWKVPYFTTIAGAVAAAEGIEVLQKGGVGVRSLQEYHGLD
ncbi:MAG: carbamoyl-phosphate synthase large subunit, partial [bacterium]